MNKLGRNGPERIAGGCRLLGVAAVEIQTSPTLIIAIRLALSRFALPGDAGTATADRAVAMVVADLPGTDARGLLGTWIEVSSLCDLFDDWIWANFCG